MRAFLASGIFLLPGPKSAALLVNLSLSPFPRQRNPPRSTTNTTFENAHCFDRMAESPRSPSPDNDSRDNLLVLPTLPNLNFNFFSVPFEKFMKDTEMSDWAGAMTLLGMPSHWSACEFSADMASNFFPDTLETYFDSRLDLLERRLKKQGERLKVRANEGLARIKTPTGEVKYAKDIEKEVQKFKIKVSGRMASLTTAWQSAKVVRTREKVRLSLSARLLSPLISRIRSRSSLVLCPCFIPPSFLGWLRNGFTSSTPYKPCTSSQHDGSLTRRKRITTSCSIFATTSTPFACFIYGSSLLMNGCGWLVIY